MRAKLFLLAMASAVLLSACGGNGYRSEGSATFSEARPEHYSGEYSESVNTSRPPFGGYPVNEHVTVRTG
jgi:hypothetical protein